MYFYFFTINQESNDLLDKLPLPDFDRVMVAISDFMSDEKMFSEHFFYKTLLVRGITNL